ncbi:peroxiredoxin [Thermodesulfobacteriota bacterium]
MNVKRTIIFITGLVFLFVAGCAGPRAKFEIEDKSAVPGTMVSRKGSPLHLLGSPVSVGGPLPSALLVDAGDMKSVDLSAERGKVLFLSIVPSLDTKVCDAQTHYLGEEGDRLPDAVERITISRDTPFAQKRFAGEAKLTDIRYLSDYKEAQFGLSTGLLIDELRLLTRSVILVDKAGVIRYLQVVPDITRLPDMERAFGAAVELANEN